MLQAYVVALIPKLTLGRFKTSRRHRSENVVPLNLRNYHKLRIATPGTSQEAAHGGDRAIEAQAARRGQARPARPLSVPKPTWYSTDCLGGRFTVGGQLALPLSEPVWSPSGYRSMSVVSASFWHAAGTECAGT